MENISAAPAARARIEYVDLLRGIGIILMVVGHTTMPGHDFLSMLRMPLFFFVSGLFFRERTWRVTITGKAERLLLPTAFFFMIGYARKLFSLWWSGELTVGTGLEWLAFWYEPTFTFPITPSWFMLSLFWVFLVYTLIVKALRPGWGREIVMLTLFAGSLWLAREQINFMYLYIDAAFFGLYFFHLGANVGNRRAMMAPWRYDLHAGIALMAAYIALCVWKVAACNMHANIIYGPVWLFVVESLVVVFSLFFLSKKINRLPIANYLGRNTIAIVGINVGVVFVIDFALRTVLGRVAPGFMAMEREQLNDILGILTAVAAVAAMVPVTWIFNKYLPWINNGLAKK